MKSLVVKRSIVVAGHKTSVSLEDAFWSGLKEIAARRVTTLSELVSEVDNQRQHTNLSSALRLFVLDFYRGQNSKMESDEQMPDDGASRFLNRVPRSAADLPSFALPPVRLTDQSVSHIVKEHARRLRLDRRQFAGHSLRAGFLTSAASRGASNAIAD